MREKCNHVQQLMLDALTAPLSAEQRRDVQQHVTDCAACRAYELGLEADDRLLRDYTEMLGPTVAGIENAVVEALDREVVEGRSRRAPRMGSRRVRLAVAAVVVCGILAWIAVLLLRLSQPTVTLAETLETMREQPWIHVVQSGTLNDGETYEYWECFEARTRARKAPGGKITYANYAENVMYSYNSNANKITVSFTTDSYMIGRQWDPVAMLSKAVERADTTGAESSRETVVENGVRVERIQVKADSEAGARSVTYIRDVARNVLVRTETTVVREGQTRRYRTTFDYPDEGPEDIYALGVPQDAVVSDIRPEGPALALADEIQERFERGLGDYLAVVLISGIDEAGQRRPSAIALLWQQDNRKRSDIYHAYDFRDRPNAPATLYPRVKDSWPDLTIPQVLDIVDANALEYRMLFDGERTIRWRWEAGQLVRDEHRIDQFKMSRGPLPDSLISLTWPNLHLRLQSGSSQFKREVRLLPEDANRPGLVGLQFVGFAEREDYWFDPDKDYLRVERVRKQEGRGMVSRLFVAQAARTAAGRWYPKVIQTQWRQDDGTVDARRELHVLLDANPTFDNDLFRLETATAMTASKAGAATTEPELASQQQDEAPVETGEPGGAPAGRVRDQQGKPIANATVLLYHKRSRWGLGNEIVEQVSTGADGKYALASPLAFDRIRQHAYAQDSYVLLALHRDYAFAWQNIEQGQEERAYDLTLTAPAVRTIMVTDHEGNPLPGARVWLYSAGDGKSWSPLFRDYLSLPTDIGLIGAVTDASGCAVVTNLPDTSCSFHATLDGYATGLAFPGRDRIRLSPGADVSGSVLTDSGDPVGGARVSFETKWMHQYFQAESDAEGRFALADLPARGWDMGPWGESEGASGAYTIAVKHEDYAAADTDIELLPGQTVDDLVISVRTETTLVRCLVLEEGTDKPVAGARISGSNKIGSINGYSDANGVFTVRVLPGSASLRFHSPPDGVYVVEEPGSGDHRVTFNAEGDEMDVTLPAPAIAGRLCSVSGTVYDPQGLSVSNAVVYAAAGYFDTATATGYVRPAGADTNGRFELQEIPAGRDLHIYVETKDRMLAFADVFPIPADVNEFEPLELVLQPTATAVTVIEDEQGSPVANTSLQISPMVQGERIWPAGRRARTDHLGTLEIDGIIPGFTYHLRDARFDQGGRRPEGWEEWFKRVIVLIPLE